MKTRKGELRPKISIIALTAFFILAFVSSGWGTTIEVPNDQPTIQDGINASSNHDTVLVAPGTYFENIRYLGKNIVVASHYLLDHNPENIFNTIIDGSNPVDPDTASVVRIVDLEDSTAQLTGFTIQNGTGTKWPDPHGFGNYREGGGILCEFTSPTISFNRIINNDAIDMSGGMVSAGGGGIRCGDGNPKILDNIIMYNRGRYGAGIVLNFATGVVKNNVIAYNSGGQDFGGAGVWKYQGRDGLIENNTIVYNAGEEPGGGIFVWTTSATIRNNIIRGNTARSFPQIGISSATVDVSYSDVEGGYSGTANIDSDPRFFGSYFYPAPGSPAIDAGNPDPLYNDIEDPAQAGQGLWPAMGDLTNDMGAYGGQGGATFELLSVLVDTTYGWVPLSVNFQSFCHIAVSAYNWDFKDGASASGSTVNHIFDLAGNFDVALSAVTGGGAIDYTLPVGIAAIADTLIIPEYTILPGSTLVVSIYGRNSAPLSSIFIPLTYDGNLPLTYDSISTVGCRTDYFAQADLKHSDPSHKRMVIRLNNSVGGTQPELPPGTGDLVKVYFTAATVAPAGDTAGLSMAGYNTFSASYAGSILSYNPDLVGGKATAISCCVNRGDVNGQGGPTPVNIEDLTYFVAYLFSLGPRPPCLDEADLDGNGSIQISDVTYIVDFLFSGGLEPAACP